MNPISPVKRDEKTRFQVPIYNDRVAVLTNDELSERGRFIFKKCLFLTTNTTVSNHLLVSNGNLNINTRFDLDGSLQYKKAIR